ncbi:sodium/hydrogen exchanger 9B2-like [Ciona intestinalis]
MFSSSTSTSTLVRADSGVDFSDDRIHGKSFSTSGQGFGTPSTSSNELTPETTPSTTTVDEDVPSGPPTWKQRLWPPRGRWAKWLTWFLVMCGFYGAVWALIPERMTPFKLDVHTGQTFGLVLTIMLCFTAEILFVKIPTPKGLPPLPPLLASLLMGLALKNLPAPLNIADHINVDVSRSLRELSLTVILTRAGLEIDPEAMAKVKWAVIRLAFMPCIAETVTIGITAYLILGFPFIWSFMMGFMIAAVSPAVVIPSLIILQGKGLGVSKGVPSLVMAASGIDDVLAIGKFANFLPNFDAKIDLSDNSGKSLITTVHLLYYFNSINHDCLFTLFLAQHLSTFSFILYFAIDRHKLTKNCGFNSLLLYFLHNIKSRLFIYFISPPQKLTKNCGFNRFLLYSAGFTVLLGIAIPGGLEEEIIEYMSQTFFGGGTDTYDGMTTPLYEATTAAFNVTNSTAAHGGGSTTNIGKEIGGAIIEVIIGIVSGLVLGMLISYIPSRKMRYRHFCRGFLLLSIGIIFVFGTEIWGIPGAGALCALVMSFTASLHWKEETHPLEKSWHFMWTIFQPILFGLTGTLVEVEMMDPVTCGLGLAVLACAMCGRLLMSTSVTFGLNLKLKERLFVSVAWIPKGTVQAALGSTAYDQAMRLNRSAEEIYWGQQILVIAVLATLITAPIGAFGIAIAGPKLLSVGDGDDPNPHDNEAYEGDNENSSDGNDSVGKDWKQKGGDPHDVHDDGYITTDTESVQNDHDHHYTHHHGHKHHNSHHHGHHKNHYAMSRNHSGLEFHVAEHDLDNIKEEDDEAISKEDAEVTTRI